MFRHNKSFYEYIKTYLRFPNFVWHSFIFANIDFYCILGSKLFSFKSQRKIELCNTWDNNQNITLQHIPGPQISHILRGGFRGLGLAGVQSNPLTKVSFSWGILDKFGIPCFPEKFTSLTLLLPVKVFKITGRVANSVDPVQTPRSAASDLCLHCLLRPVWVSTVIWSTQPLRNHPGSAPVFTLSIRTPELL